MAYSPRQQVVAAQAEQVAVEMEPKQEVPLVVLLIPAVVVAVTVGVVAVWLGPQAVQES